MVCKILHIHDRFRSPSQFFHEIDKVRSLVSAGDMRVVSETTPLCEVTGNSRGYMRFETECVCGSRFAVWLDEAGGGSKLL